MAFTYQNSGVPGYSDWLRGWKEWARTRKRGKMAQFIIEKLEEGQQAKWLDITNGEFELTEWHSIAKEWFGEKPRNSEEVDAPCMLRKGLPRAFPGLEEVKERSRKEGTQYRSRVFKAPPILIQEVVMHITNHQPPLAQNGFSYIGSTSTTTAGVGSYTSHIPNGMVSSSNYYNGSGGLYTSSTAGVKLELPPSAMMNHTSPPPPSAGYMPPNGEQYIPQVYSGGNHSDIDQMAQAIADNNMDTTQYQGGSWSSNSYPTPPPTAGTLLSVPQSPATYISSDDVTGGLIGSPKGHQYNPSPTGSSHSPRISPEPSHLSSYPPSVPYSTTDQLSPPSGATQEAAESEIMEIKAMPNKSPLEGGGYMAIIFYKQLPPGQKVIYFLSRSNPHYYVGQAATEENILTLSCQIPKYPYPEEVELCVYCDNQHIASTSFTFYQQQMQMLPPADMMLQILGTQLQTHFPQMGGSYGTVDSSSGGAGTSTTGGYAGSIPSSMYSLLLGACRMGCEPLVHCLMSSPVMEELSFEQLQEAHDCAINNGHMTLADHLSDMVLLHDSRIPTPLLARDGDTSAAAKHVPAYYDALDQLEQGGDSPVEKANTVMRQLLSAMNMLKTPSKAEDSDGNTTQQQEKEQKEEEEDGDKTLVEEKDGSDMIGGDVATPIVEVQGQGAHPLGGNSQKLNITTPTKRRTSTSKLQHQPSVLDEDEPIPDNTTLELLVPPTQQHSRASLIESLDNVGELPSSPRQHKLVTAQMSDADSAIGMSFEEDPHSVIFSEVQRRRSSLYTSDPVMKDVLSIKLPPEAGVEVANSLEWEGGIMITEDFPPNSDQKLFYKGDRICQVGDRIIRNKTAEVSDFAEFFQMEACKGTTIKILPSMMEVPEPPSKTKPPPPRRTPSEQSMLDSIKSKINSITSTRPLVSQRKVEIPRAAYGSSFKMLGGNVTGVFISDVRSDVSETISSGDQILEINGNSTDGLSLYDVNQLLLQTTSSDIDMTVVKNISRFQYAREQLEVDSFYMRSLFDYTPTSHKEMTLHKGMLLRVINTSICAPNHWLVWSVDERTGMEMQMKKIPTPSQAKKQHGKDVYERVTRSESVKRPVCVVGPGSNDIATDIASNNKFTLCPSLMDVLSTYAKGQTHAVFSIEDTDQYHLLSGLNPIVLQTRPVDKMKVQDHLKYSTMKIDASLSNNTADEAISVIHHQQASAVWHHIGVIH